MHGIPCRTCWRSLLWPRTPRLAGRTCVPVWRRRKIVHCVVWWGQNDRRPDLERAQLLFACIKWLLSCHFHREPLLPSTRVKVDLSAFLVGWSGSCSHFCITKCSSRCSWHFG